MKVYNKIKTFLRWFILVFIIYQVATSTTGMWIALIVGFFIIRLVLRLFISAVYLLCMAFIFIVLISLLII
ncbi:MULTISPECIES: hypothetical protein [Bacteroidaceae]|uniref:Uncharacterized protein n=1 Tax=Bacteroides finegoldii TaxID=338188 RepID=A0A7J4YRZ8_9BACE|nr:MULTISPECIES: hypothetical protein [Bacteroidaceae]KAA5219114.1 hypothetical protein F2Z28_03825 [Bacteroides finegoldii]KAA5223024.1 hypothetical protein F2Z16_03675 [Bacteroides finegoldii]KAA5226318.1 hypothetical protein F2Z20_08310 [Bacteroides finegoldii]KAA5231781.1 hypothetical protein F2Z22_05440 [Bacteroides finegoldii]KAA5235417.1 hypothetical protein F2Z17_05940 [Bacteroides finegoldii]